MTQLASILFVSLITASGSPLTPDDLVSPTATAAVPAIIDDCGDCHEDYINGQQVAAECVDNPGAEYECWYIAPDQFINEDCGQGYPCDSAFEQLSTVTTWTVDDTHELVYSSGGSIVARIQHCQNSIVAGVAADAALQ